MQKTKLGVSIGLAGSLVYFVALLAAVFSGAYVALVPLLLVAGYMLIAEDNIWLKRQAAKALGVVIFFALIQLAIHWILIFLQMIQTFVTWGDGDYFMVKPTQIIDIIEDILDYIEGILLLVMAFRALKGGEIRFGVIDGLLYRHMVGQQPMQMPGMQQQVPPVQAQQPMQMPGMQQQLPPAQAPQQAQMPGMQQQTPPAQVPQQTQ